MTPVTTDCQHPETNVIDLGQLWVVSYSLQQGCPDVLRLGELCQIHMCEILNGYSNGYIVLGVYKAMDEALEACDELMPGIEAAMNRRARNDKEGRS